MIQPEIIEMQHDDKRAVVRLALPHDAEVFRGHFPSMPILSGVAQIDWVMRLASRCFHLAKPVADNFQVKFSRVIEPDAALVLTLELDPINRRLTFVYRVDEQIMSSGRIKIENVA